MEKWTIQVIAGQVWTIEVYPLTGCVKFWNTGESPNMASGIVIETTLVSLHDLRDTIEYAEEIMQEIHDRKE